MAIVRGHDPYALLGLPQETPMGRREEMATQDAYRRRAMQEQFTYGLYDDMLRARTQMQIAEQRDQRMVEMQGAEQQFRQQQNDVDFQQQQQILRQQGQQQQQNFDHQFTAKQQADLATWTNNKNALEAQVVLMERINERVKALDMVNTKLGSIKPVPVPKPPPVDLNQLSNDSLFHYDDGGALVPGGLPRGVAGTVFTVEQRNGQTRLVPHDIKPPVDEAKKQAADIEAKRIDTQSKIQIEKAKYMGHLLKIQETVPGKGGKPDTKKTLYTPEDAKRMADDAFRDLMPPDPTAADLGDYPLDAPPAQGQPAPQQAPPIAPPQAAAPPVQQQAAPVEPLSPQWFQAEPELKPIADAMRREQESGGKNTDAYLKNFRATMDTPAKRPRSEADVVDGAVYDINGRRWVAFKSAGRARFVPLPGG
jgi:hypothetical protein